MASKNSYASALSPGGPLFASPPPVMPPQPTPPPKHHWGSAKIDYDEVITKAFTFVPPVPTISWLMFRSIYYDHPERIEVTSSPHSNHKDDPIHISLKVYLNDSNKHFLTVHIFGTFAATPWDKGYIKWWNQTMEAQMTIKGLGGYTVVKEMVADWRTPTTPTSADD